MENGTRSLCWDRYNTVNMCTWDFILKAIILLLVVISIIIGNSLVISAVALYRKLRKSVSNSFIASLAVADLLLGVIILPFSMSQELLGYWICGPIMCEIWLVTDIWICTASILHLCAISVDRYLAIAFPLKYPTLMTHKRCRIICLSMWILSFVICFPALIRWNGENGKSYIMNQTTNATDSIPAKCDVVNASGYTIYSALGSFFIPSVVMTGFYIKIFLLAQSFMKQSYKGVIVKQAGDETMRIHRGVSTKASLYKTVRTTYEMSDLISTTGEQRTEKNGSDGFYQHGSSKDEAHQYNMDTVSSGSPAHSTLRRCSYKSDRSETNLLNSLKKPKTKATVRTTLNRETRAAKTVAIIVGGFILCWSPFFVCYLLKGVGHVAINSTLFDVFFWIGYINSLLNPCIYAYFSIDYRHAFKRILRCKLQRDFSRRGMWKYVGSLYISSSSDRHNSFSIKPQHLNNTTT